MATDQVKNRIRGYRKKEDKELQIKNKTFIH